MNRQIEQSLSSIIPSLGGPLPSELVQLATSLVAQSRSKASSLKPDEEVARTHVCAHIACERLKQSLDLPPIISRPPCPPRVYKKLYSYFDTVLPSRALRKPMVEEATNRLAISPVKPQTPSRSTLAITPRKTPARVGNTNKDDDLPEWFMPIVRQICKALNSPAAIPHVYVGVSSVMKLQDPILQESDIPIPPKRGRGRPRKVPTVPRYEESQIPPILVVILLYTLARLTGENTTPEQYGEQRSQAIQILRTVKAVEAFPEGELIKSIENYMREAQNGWLELEWYLNIMEGSGATVDDDDDDEVFEESEIASHIPQGEIELPRSGLGTMMQNKIDYLSEENKEGYQEWKGQMMTRIAAIQAEQPAQSAIMST